MLVFIDESGDPGMNSHQRYFVIVVLIFDDLDQAIRMQTRIKYLLKSSGKVEFRFSQCKAAERDAFFQEVNQFTFRVGAVIVDKEVIRSAALRSDSRKFYNYFLKQSLLSSNVSNARIRLDGKANRRLRGALVSYLNSQRKGMVKNFQMKDSKSDPLIQAADMIAGAIARSCYSHKPTTLAGLRNWKAKYSIFGISDE